jgi:hypothetical protein
LKGGAKKMAQNLVSASLTPEVKTEILQKLTEIKNALDFLLSLQPKEVRSLFKPGNTFAPLIDKAYHVVVDHPEILPAIFDKEEFIKDYLLSKDLTPIDNQINELSESVTKTLMAINSDALNETMEVYAAVKQNKDKVPGLNVVAEEMAEFFKKAGKKVTPPQEQIAATKGN